MSTVSQTWDHFKGAFPTFLNTMLQSKNSKLLAWAAGTTILAGRLLQISSFIGGTAAVGTGFLTALAAIQLDKSYSSLSLDRQDELVAKALRASKIVAPIFSSGVVASLIGHPISLLGRVALTGIFLVSTIAIQGIAKKANRTTGIET